ncbi:MAG: mechanosensitive ion channel family protein [Candidatus Coatesbacteria bacterium]|nr:MAG: mechanosensitive ion channel family protein [Candidatus Coatesbacteria bacterium]RLC41684.1 MAG: mechanosensitive ion channel family protein [Candidatus Coatesbacteria bacterium]
MVDISSIVSSEWFIKAVKVVIIAILGFIFARYLPKLVRRVLEYRVDEKIRKIAQKFVLYIVVSVAVIIILQTLEIEISSILATAGLLSIAVGFAAQTTLSNLISGLMIFSERPFEIGDVIKVEDKLGVVQSIDILSTKVKTFNNLFVRIPNSSLIEKMVTNYTKYPVRRLDILVDVSYMTDLERAKEVIEDALRKCKTILLEPRPFVAFESFGESGITLRIFGWIDINEYLAGLTELAVETKKALDREGIEIPFPQRVVRFTEETEDSLRAYWMKKSTDNH